MKKSPVEMNLDERKADLIRHMFIDPADENYLTARWAYESGLFHQFYWNAAQSIEKLLKAGLLFNGHSVIEHNKHNLKTLFQAFLEIDQYQHLPEVIRLPPVTAMGKENWDGVSYIVFLEYLDHYGSPENRYGNMGTFLNGPDIHLLDECCCSFRRFIRNNNFFGADLHQINNEMQFWDDQVSEPLEWMISPGFLLERLYRRRYQVGQNERLRRVFSNMNLSFFPEREDNESTFGGIHISGSPVHNHLVRLYEQKGALKNYMSEEQQAYNREVIPRLKEWVNRSIYLGKKLRKELKL